MIGEEEDETIQTRPRFFYFFTEAVNLARS